MLMEITQNDILRYRSKNKCKKLANEDYTNAEERN